jgi:hypothetical protein
MKSQKDVVDLQRHGVIIRTHMRKGTHKGQMTEMLRSTIAESGIPLLRLSKETGVARASLIRFVRGETSLRLDVADQVAQYFGLVLIPDRSNVAGGRTRTKRKAAD